MLCKTNAAFTRGIEAIPILVETDVSKGMPGYHVVGQPDNSIKESAERIRLAVNHSGFEYPKGRITVNMSPAVLRKSGSHFDLSIAIGLLAATSQVYSDRLHEYCFLGELSLDGTVNGIRGVLPMVMAVQKAGIRKVIVPKDNEKEAMLVEGITVYGVSHLVEVVLHLAGTCLLEGKAGGVMHTRAEPLHWEMDYEDVHGQEGAKRAIVTAVAGGHGLLMMGSPSTGKTMLAERIPTIMPEMTMAEILQVTKAYSIAGLLSAQDPIITRRPFRRPHHKLTLAGLLGGGAYPKPGEITLADKGVLFLDEMGEFDYKVMEALRIPMEKKEIHLLRNSGEYTFPADFQLVGSSNPCPCGYLGDPKQHCKCSAGEISRYLRKFSGPIMDRIDMHIYLSTIAYEDLQGGDVINSENMRQQILAAREVQRVRYENEDFLLNGQLDERNINRFAPLNQASEKMLALAYDRLSLNPRTLLKVRKLARTIADLEQSDEICENHIQEALQYRERIYGR